MWLKFMAFIIFILDSVALDRSWQNNGLKVSLCSESPSSFLSGGRQAQRAVGASLKRAGGGVAGGVLRERWWAGGPLRSDRPVLGQRPRRNNSPGLAVEAGTEKTREPEGVWDRS